MLEKRKDGLLDATCSGCLKSVWGITRERLEAEHWEERHDGQLWCLRCSIAKRQVQFPSPVAERRHQRERKKRFGA